MLPVLIQLFLDWLHPFIESIHTLSPQKQLLLSASVVWCIVRLEIPYGLIEFEFAPLLLENLCAKNAPTESQQWEEYNHLCLFIPKACRFELLPYTCLI